MIYTLTMNPSLDYVMEIDTLTVGQMNRSQNTYLLPGGKGINVSMVLKELEMPSIAILPVAGFTGEKLLKMMEEKGVEYEAIEIACGNTRINVKVLGNQETELNADGPNLSEEEKEILFDRIKQLSEDDYLILSGSVPKALGDNFYADIMKLLMEKEVNIILDTTGENFKNALMYQPFLVKPNQSELETFFGMKADSKEMLTDMAEKIRALGAKNVLVSLGDKGAFLLTEKGQIYWQTAPNGKVKNTVGAGDSMVAGFVAEYIQSKDMKKALQQGIAAGSASAFSKNLATKEEIDALMKNL